jgi:hypothetical protein
MAGLVVSKRLDVADVMTQVTALKSQLSDDKLIAAFLQDRALPRLSPTTRARNCQAFTQYE